MGVIYSIRCRKCGNAFNRKYGVGYNGQGTLYCDRCGKAHGVDFSCGWGWEPTCECGGTFDADALGFLRSNAPKTRRLDKEISCSAKGITASPLYLRFRSVSSPFPIIGTEKESGKYH